LIASVVTGEVGLKSLVLGVNLCFLSSNLLLSLRNCSQNGRSKGLRSRYGIRCCRLSKGDGVEEGAYLGDIPARFGAHYNFLPQNSK